MYLIPNLRKRQYFLCFSPIFGLLRNFTSSLEAAIVKDIVEKWMVKVGENG
jgi:hypothetical protein